MERWKFISYSYLVSHEVEMAASSETFTFSLSVGRCGQLRVEKDRLRCISGKSEPLL